jgi:hypothetical protein
MIMKVSGSWKAGAAWGFVALIVLFLTLYVAPMLNP